MISNKELVDYLNQRGVRDDIYRSFVQRYRPDNYKFIMCSANGFDYIVSHFLDKSERKGYGLIATNETLQTEKSGQLAIGLIEGDDVICIDPQTGRISLWLVQTGNNDYVTVAESFQGFIESCCEKLNQSKWTDYR